MMMKRKKYQKRSGLREWSVNRWAGLLSSLSSMLANDEKKIGERKRETVEM